MGTGCYAARMDETPTPEEHPPTRYCTSAARHWFTYYGCVGSSAPTCRHCGARNPNYDPNRDPFRRTDG